MIDNERKRKLLESAKKFNKSKKDEIFTLGSQIQTYPVIPTGIQKLDDFLGGGFKKGGHTIVYGPFSIGKTALVLQAIANAQQQGYTVCYVNTEKPIDIERFQFFGINLDDLLYIEAPENAELALEGLRTLAKDKVIDLFIIDSTNGLCPKSVQETKTEDERGLDKKNVAALPATLSNFYNVVNSQIFKAQAAVVWIGQLRTKGIGSYFVRDGLTGGNAQSFYAYQILRMNKGQKTNSPFNKIKHYYLDEEKIRYKSVDEECGFSIVFKLEKTNSSKSAKNNAEIELPYVYSKGIVNEFVSTEEVVYDGTEEIQSKIKEQLQNNKKGKK